MNSRHPLDDQFRSQLNLPPYREPERPIEPEDESIPDLALAVTTANRLVREDKDWKDELIGKLLLNIDADGDESLIVKMLHHYFDGHIMDAGTVFGIEVEKAIYELADENIGTFGVVGGSADE